MVEILTTLITLLSLSEILPFIGIDASGIIHGIVSKMRDIHLKSSCSVDVDVDVDIEKKTKK